MASLYKTHGNASGARGFIASIWRYIKGALCDLIQGDIYVKLSSVICGASCFARRQYAKGALITLAEALLLYLIPSAFWPYISKLNTLGTVQQQRTYNPVTRQNDFNNYDNSFLIMLFGVIGVAIIVLAAILWLRNIRAARQLQLRAEHGGHVNSFREDANEYLGHKFYRTLLSLPVAGVVCFTIVPLIVMALTAFTNYDRNHLVPAKLFSWVGLSNFETLFNMTADSTFAYAFSRVLVWTLV